MSKRYFLLPFLLLLAISYGEDIEVNGGFERVVASKTGQVLPDGWLINQPCCKDCIVLISKNPAEVREGNFSLWLEGESSQNQAYLLRYASRMSVKPGDVLRMSVWAQGQGEVSLGVIASGALPDSAQTLGTRTLTGGRIPVKAPTSWQKCEFSITVKPIRKNDLVFNDLSFVPIIYTFNMDVLLLDDCTFTLERADGEELSVKQEN